MIISSINPATEDVLAEFQAMAPEQVDAILDQTRATYRQWRQTSFEHRAGLMRQAGIYLPQHKARFAGLITAEMGKPITEAEAEVEKCAWNCDYYADNAARFLADDPIATNARESFVAYEPLGTVLAIMPWNYPLWQV